MAEDRVLPAPSFAQGRLRVLARSLVASCVNGDAVPAPPADPRNVVSGTDAVEAVLVLVGRIDALGRRGVLPAVEAEMICALLMVVHEHLLPLPAVCSPEGDELVARDLTTIVSMMVQGELRAREARAA
ncbi:hypothetical protein ACIQWN_32335 [Streptomyces vinaceus]|uniref:hypothetical protein n=1 Tax=Streptomyces vinaceus TaxID=1960 RepID=UPI00381E8953